MQKIDRAYVASKLPARDENASKNAYGRLLIAGGSVPYSGSVCLSAKAAVHSGCGLVFAAVPAPLWSVAATRLQEAMVLPIPSAGFDEGGFFTESSAGPLLERLEKCSVLAIGPGLGRDRRTVSFVLKVLETTEKPVIADADALFALGTDLGVLDSRKGRATILTPHAGEYSFLTNGRDIKPSDFAREHGCVLVCKAHRTEVYAPDGRAMVNTTGNSGLSKGGSGDVLTGLAGSMLCQGLEAFDAACVSVWLHGRAADLLLPYATQYCMAADMLVDSGFPMAFRDVLNCGNLENGVSDV